MVDGGTVSVWENLSEDCHYVAVLFGATRGTQMTHLNLKAPCRLHFLHAQYKFFFLHIFPSVVELWHVLLDNLTQLIIVSGPHHTIQNRDI